MMRLMLGSSAVALALLGAAPAHADEVFNICGSGRVGVATTVTSCAFANEVRYSYLSQGGPVVSAYSPVTGMFYDMQCAGGFISHLNDGEIVRSVRCVGGDDAVVVIW